MGVSVVVILSSRRSQLDLLKIQQRSSGICTLRGTNYLDQGGGGGDQKYFTHAQPHKIRPLARFSSIRATMTSPISFTVRPPSAPIRPSPLGNGLRAGPPSRRLFEQGAEDVEEEQGRSRSRPREERLEGFRNGRAHGSVAFLMHQSTADLGRSGERPAEPLVIPAIPNRDWRQSSTRRTPSFRPEDSGRNGPIETYERSGDQPARSGIRNEVRMEVGMNGETGKVEQTEEAVLPDGSASTSIVSVKAEPLSLEEQALRAILAGDAQQESEEERAQRELVIAMGGDGATTPMSEDEAFKRDVATLPKEVSSPKPISATSVDPSQSSLDDYDAVPVSAFGMAMARGMGWNPSSKENTTVHEPKLRPQLLGLGATPMDATVRPTHNHGDSKKKHQDRNTRSGRGFIATSLLVKKERDGSGSGSVTPAGSGSADESDGSRRRRWEDDCDSERESKRRAGERNGDGDGYRDKDRDRGRYETEEEERAKRKASQRERERDRDRYTNGDRERHTNGDGEKYRDDQRDRDERERRRGREQVRDRR